MTNSEIIDKYSTGQFISGEEFFMESEVLKFLDAAREDEAGKWESQLKSERERAGKLLEALERVLLFSFNQKSRTEIEAAITEYKNNQ